MSDLESTRIKRPADKTACHNCGYLMETDSGICPGCGASRALVRSGSMSLAEYGQMAGGIVLGLGSIILPLFGSAGAVVLYYLVKERLPALASGIKYGLITLLVIIMGAIALCFVNWPH